MPAPTSDPTPVACVSRMRPPTPVSAPGKGATAQGKLWVSAVNRMSRSRVATASGPARPGAAGHRHATPPAGPRMADELSLKPTTLLPGCAASVDRTMSNSVSPTAAPSTLSAPRKNQCRLCSLLLWAMSNSSTVVGSRFRSSRNRDV